MRIALVLAPALALSVLATAGCSHAPRRVEESNLGYLDDEAVRGAPAAAAARPVVPTSAGSIERAELERVLAAGPAPVLAEYELGADLVGGRFQGWTIKRTTRLEQAMFLFAGFALVYPGALADLIGFGLVAVALAMQYFRRDRLQPA